MKRTAWHWLIPILVLGLLLAMLSLNGHLVAGGDNATYMILGQSLATGQGYRMVNDPRLPEMALYPPGYPLLLAAIVKLTATSRNLGTAVFPMKLVSVALYLACIALAYVLLSRRSARLAPVATLLLAVSPQILHFATEISTEMPYLLLSLSALLLFEGASREQGPTVNQIALTATCLALAFYVRSIALVMVAAFGLHLLARRRLGHAVLLVVAVVVLAVPWFIHSGRLPATGVSVGLGRGYFALYLSGDPYGTAQASAPELVSRLVFNLRMYAVHIWPDALFPHALSAMTRLGRAGYVFPLLVSLLALLGFLIELRRGFASEWYVALFFVSCVGYIWAQSRLIVPIIPFVLFYLCSAIDSIAKWVWKGRNGPSTYALALACGMIALSLLLATARQIGHNLRFGMGHSTATYYSQDPVWANYWQSMDWIARANAPGAVAMCRKADLLYVLTGHPSLEYPYSPDALELKRSVRENRVAYVIEDAFRWTPTTVDYLKPALQAWRAAEPGALDLAFETSAPQTRVWRVNP